MKTMKWSISTHNYMQFTSFEVLTCVQINCEALSISEMLLLCILEIQWHWHSTESYTLFSPISPDKEEVP